MRKKRELLDGVFYHVTSRTNDKIRVFDNRLGRRIILTVLQDTKEKFAFRLANFCVMPTHIHLLMQPAKGADLSPIMQWIKTRSARLWNLIHGSKDHLWGDRYFARPVNGKLEFDDVMEYISQNPVKAGLVETPEEWKASGSFYICHNISGLIDCPDIETKTSNTLPVFATKFLPLKQLAHINKYYGAYAESIENLTNIIPLIPAASGRTETQDMPVYLHYTTKTADYFVSGYDGDDLLYGKVRYNVYPAVTEYRKFSLDKLKRSYYMELDLSWVW